MAFEMILPSLSAGMEDAVIARWLVSVGERVTKGQVLAEVETDKATMELEAEADGVIASLNVPEGKRADVGQVVVIVLAEGEAAVPSAATQSPQTSATTPQLAGSSAVATPADHGERMHKASPIARRLAAGAGIDLGGVQGSGPRGRIVKIDVERLIHEAGTASVASGTPVAPQSIAVPTPVQMEQAAPALAPAGIGPYEAQPVSNMRRVVARRLVEAKQSIPHFYLNADCDMEALLALRAQLNEGREKAEKISVNDLILKAVARALRKVPAANVIWHGDEILQLADVDISVAVAIDGGLITPILRGADRMSLGTLSAEMKTLARLAREGKLKPEQYQGGGFSVSNLGMYGVKSFSAIINPPQSCILAVGATERRPVGRCDQIVLSDVMSITLSVDHRSVDGALGAVLLAAVKEGIENPLSLVL